MGKGIVKWYDRAKGFGFITRKNKRDLFLHHTALNGTTVTEGDSVEFDIGEGPKGDCAHNIKVVK